MICAKSGVGKFPGSGPGAGSWWAYGDPWPETHAAGGGSGSDRADGDGRTSRRLRPPGSAGRSSSGVQVDPPMPGCPPAVPRPESWRRDVFHPPLPGGHAHVTIRAAALRLSRARHVPQGHGTPRHGVLSRSHASSDGRRPARFAGRRQGCSRPQGYLGVVGLSPGTPRRSFRIGRPKSAPSRGRKVRRIVPNDGPIRVTGRRAFRRPHAWRRRTDVLARTRPTELRTRLRMARSQPGLFRRGDDDELVVLGRPMPLPMSVPCIVIRGMPGACASM